MANNNYSITVTVSESVGIFSTSITASIDNMKEVHRIDEVIQATDSLIETVMSHLQPPADIDEEHA